MNPLLLILGGGAVLYYLSQSKSTAATPATTPATTTPSTAPGATAPAPTSTVPSTTPPATTSTIPATPSLSLEQIHTALVNTMKQHPDVVNESGEPFATFSQFNWYLNQVSGVQNLPTFYDASGGTDDPNVALPIDVYWGIIEPWLKTNRGLSGINRRQAPPLLWKPFVGPGGWRA